MHFPAISFKQISIVSTVCSLSALMLASTSVIAQSMKSDASAMDKHFVMGALKGGMAEVQLGQLASEKGSSDDVKQFGQKMVADHGKMGEDMKGVASQIGVTPPAMVTPKDQALMTRLQGLSGKQFDIAYIRAMVKDHEKDLQEFKAEASGGTSSTVKDAATQGSEVISHHLEMIKQIAQTHHVMMGAKMEGTEKSGQ